MRAGILAAILCGGAAIGVAIADPGGSGVDQKDKEYSMGWKGWVFDSPPCMNEPMLELRPPDCKAVLHPQIEAEIRRLIKDELAKRKCQ